MDDPAVDGRAAVADRLTVAVPVDGTALVCSDLHLGQAATAASSLMERDLVARLDRWEGPGALVLNGDVIELWGDPGGTVDRALDAHPALTAALRRFADRPDRTLIVVAGNHDAPIAWDGVSPGVLAGRLGAACALSADLVFDTPAGRRTVRCEHGHAFDPANAFADPRNPLDSPLGQHIVQEVLPEVRRTPMLADVGALADPNAIGRFLASRLVYRALGRQAWWLLLPLLIGLVLRTPALARLVASSAEFRRVERWTAFAAVGLVADVAVVAVLAVLVARAVYAAMANSRLGPRGMHLNGTPRAAAAAMCAGGLAGFVSGHTHQPELTAVAGGFYANCGAGVRAVEQRSGRWFLPPVFVAVLRRSWVELDVEGDVRARLVVAESPAGEATWLERLAVRRHRAVPATAEVVATVPGQAGWPLQQESLARRAGFERVRRRSAILVGAVAVLGAVSAATAPNQRRLAALREVLPVEVPRTAAASVVFLSAGLFLLAWGLRRGRGLAWAFAVGLLAVSAVLHLLKGLDLEEAVVSLLVAGWLVRHRAAFPTHPDRRQVRDTSLVLAAGAVLVVTASLLLAPAARGPGGSGRTAKAVAERLVGLHRLPLATTVPMVTPALIAAGFILLLMLGRVLLRPHLRPRPDPAGNRADLARARTIVAAHGRDTLAYFALRADKSWFFTGDCVVAYDVRDGVCLVSPDPIGPPQQWVDAWAQFTAFAEGHGWPVTVVGAAEGWLPIYRAAGLHPWYLGDEAIVDCAAFTLDGRSMKNLRNAYNRVQRAGYSVRFYDPATVPAGLADELRRLSTQSRQGETERGFSMTLSRLFDPGDTGLLLAVAFGPDGRPGGFCHWIPAADIAGWSLDLMRRSTDHELPNGLTDFIIIETINRLKARGEWGLGLNFAVMRGVLAGERGEGPLSDLQRRLLHHLSDATQLESLWRYNDKYHPYWRPRYIVLSGVGNAPLQGLAITDAEGFDPAGEIPVIGRLIGRHENRGKR
jgi:lysyl-tRNA synthetase class 2